MRIEVMRVLTILWLEAGGGSAPRRRTFGCGSRLSLSIMADVSIRLTLQFPAPLDADAAIKLALAAAALPEVRRSILSPDRRLAVWYAGEMPCERAVAALAEAGLSAVVQSGLAPEAEAVLAAPSGERFRPIGR